MCVCVSIYLPVSHVLPVYSLGHEHSKRFTKLVHFPLFLQGLLAHSSMSDKESSHNPIDQCDRQKKTHKETGTLIDIS